MKNLKKTLALLLCAVLLVAGSVAGTLAYLQSQTAVVNNTFTVGDIVIKLDETDIDGSATGAGVIADRDLKNVYSGDNKLIPGQPVTKDPTVWVKGTSEPAYIRMIVTVGNYDKLFDAVDYDAKFINEEMVVLSELVTWNYETWRYVDFNKSADGKTGTYEFRYYPNNGIYEASTGENDHETEYNRLPALFTAINVPDAISNSDLAMLANVSIDVVAHAIQSEGFANEDAAWDAFNAA